MEDDEKQQEVKSKPKYKKPQPYRLAPLLSRDEVSKFLGVKNQTLQNYRKMGMPYIKKANKFWYEAHEVIHWFKSGKYKAAQLKQREANKIKRRKKMREIRKRLSATDKQVFLDRWARMEAYLDEQRLSGFSGKVNFKRLFPEDVKRQSFFALRKKTNERLP